MFDPAYPPFEAEIESAPLRAQFNGLKDLIDAVPTVTSAQVDVVHELPPGQSPVVEVSITGGVLHFAFSIPSGAEGPPGEVTQAQLADGLETRAHAVHHVSPLALTAEGEYSPAQVQEIADKVDEMLNVMKGS